MKKIEKILKILGISTIIIITLFPLLFIVYGFFIEPYITRPNSSEMMQYAEEKYNKEFELIRDYTHNEYYGDNGRVKKNNPTIEVEDISTGIRFEVGARYEADSWNLRDSFAKESLIFCLKEQNVLYSIEHSIPHLFLNNNKDDAEKLQRVVIQFNEIYTVNLSKAEAYSSYASFQIPGILFEYQIYGGYINDGFIERDSPFYFDTPIEKYERFLNSVYQ